MQQRQPCQVFQERVGGIKNLGQEVETFPLVVIQDLDGKKKKRTITDDSRGSIKSAAKVTMHLNIHTSGSYTTVLSIENIIFLGLCFPLTPLPDINRKANNNRKKYVAVLMVLQRQLPVNVMPLHSSHYRFTLT